MMARELERVKGRGLPINRLIGLSRSFSLIGLDFSHLVFWLIYLALAKVYFEKQSVDF